MINTLEPYWDILPTAQKQLWNDLAETVALGFVLYGGTAIALRLGHRVSVDFDFFTDKPLDETKLRQTLRVFARSETLQQSADTLTVLARPTVNAAPVKISFFGAIDFGRIGIPTHTADGVLQVASVEDLLATKLKIILQRIEAKDYQDMAALLRSGASLPQGLAAARLMFGNTFQPSEALKALTWFRGGDLDTLPLADRRILVEASSQTGDLPPVELASGVLSAFNT